MSTYMRIGGANWRFSNGANLDTIGFVALWFDDQSGVPTAQQADAGYRQTGGCPFQPTSVEFQLKSDENDLYFLDYPPDPPMRELARAEVGDETVVVFDYAWVAIVQKNGDFVVARCD